MFVITGVRYNQDLHSSQQNIETKLEAETGNE
jgi:hypothetical protein